MSHRGKGKKKIVVTCSADKKDEDGIQIQAQNSSAPLKSQTLGDNNGSFQKANTVIPGERSGSLSKNDKLNMISSPNKSFNINSRSNSPLKSSMTMAANNSSSIIEEEANIKLSFLEQIENLKDQLKKALDTNELLEKKNTIGTTTKVSQLDFPVQKRIEELELQVTELQEQNIQLKNRLQTEGQASSEEIKRLQNQSDSKDLKIGILEESEQALKKVELQLTSENLELKNSYDRSNSILDQSIKDATDLNLKVQAADKEIKNLKNTLNIKEDEILQAQNLNKELKEEGDRAQSQLKEEAARVQSQLKEEAARAQSQLIEDAATAQSQLKEDAAKAQSQYESKIESMNAERYKEVLEQESKIQNLQKELTETQKSLSEVLTELYNLQAQSDGQKSILNQLQIVNDALREDNEKLNTSNQSLIESQKQLQMETIIYRERLNTENKQHQAHLKEYLDKKESEIRKREGDCNEEIAKMKEFVEIEIRNMQQEREKNKRIFSFEGQQTFNKQRKEIATLQSALSSTENEVKDLKELVQRMRKESTEQQIQRGRVI